MASRTRGFVWLGERIGTIRGAHDHGHEHEHGHHHHGPDPARSPWKGLIALGLADGLTPSPSALIVLLAAVSLDRVPLGVGLIVAFSCGLAAVLTAVSLALVYARRIADWFGTRGESAAGLPMGALFERVSQVSLGSIVPVAGAIALMGVGVMLTVRALSQPGLPLF
jgi:ABC-type nickel/cobalt efflux system permease component RcnA